VLFFGKRAPRGSGRQVSDSPLGSAARQQIAGNAVALANAPKRGANIPGKLVNLPNTAIGLAYGSAGHVVGELNRLRPGPQPKPRIQFGHNAVEFLNNPFGGVSAITIGNTTTYNDDPYVTKHKKNYMEHEEQHTRQGEQLGPLYLPSNLAGGLTALIRDRSWHGPSNWNERGPLSDPPRPWAPGK
jgi:hypothetical protein